MSIKEKWNERYRAATGKRQASRVLKENLQLLPDNGRALDLACGSGGNSVLLAQQGLKVEAWDIADVPVAALQDERTYLMRRNKKGWREYTVIPTSPLLVI
ncbi:MAG: hypothetical protein E4H27_10335 [Anaerolineales bacterium]|nr:MAG: hypothetical protein E4H27_10335 [Anaerolineales bacterium]